MTFIFKYGFLLINMYLFVYFVFRVSVRVQELHDAMEDKSAAKFFHVLISETGISEKNVQAIISFMMQYDTALSK